MVRGADLVLPRGTLIRLQGANGTGKTTLLRLLAGIDAPTEGRAEGRPRTAYVPERFPAALPFTAAGYLVHLGRVHGLGTAEAARRAERWLTRFDAAEYARTPLAELSKGSSQKVAVVQALMAEPDLLVLDEAWTGLDAAAREELDRAVGERVAAGATVVFVDHDPRRLAGSVDAVYLLGGGRLTAVPAASAGAVGPAGTTGPTASAGTVGPAGAAGASRVRIEATAPPGATLPPRLPGAPACQRDPDTPGRVLLTDATAHSDRLLRTLLTSGEPWHITRLTPEPAPEAARTSDGPPAPDESTATAAGPAGPDGGRRGHTEAAAPAPPVRPGAPRPAGVPRAPGRRLGPLLRCQAALLARSQRWLAPVLLYAAFAGIGIQAGQPLLDSLGYAAAALLPAGAWLARLCVTQEPPASRDVTAAAAGPGRAHLAALLTALGCTLALGVAATGLVLPTGAPVGNDRTTGIPLPSAALAGLLATACCALMGTAIGALCARPVLHRRGRSLAATVLGTLLALVAGGSPARSAVTDLVSGSQDGTVRLPLAASGAAVLLAVAVAWFTARLTAVRE
ncbi:ATP-binding cassette domain-containing protein [Streptomyces nitrosporeus]|uniref:ATP-binding cassette domain-containing protein n=1 Tax=Streptomyces nitrosporeus TaxID=28894 RepID=UPI003325A20D